MTPSNMSSSNLPSKPHASPSKGSLGRTYDSKVVSREMHRLGNLTHLPTLGPAPSSVVQSSLTLPLNAPSMVSSASIDNPWGTLHVHVLPLFNGEPLRIPVEDLNTLVKRHILSVVSVSPSKGLVALENDASDLISSGMVTLKAKLSGVEDDKLVGRIVELWGFFWDNNLPYIEGVLLPLQTDPVLSTLPRAITAHRPSDASGKTCKSSMSSLALYSPPQIDVRTIAIRAFRDQIILPIFSRLHACLTMPAAQENLFKEQFSYQQPRLQQMLLVLGSQGRQRPLSLSLTAPDPQPSAGEAAIQRLLQAVRAPLTQVSPNFSTSTPTKTPSFFSGGRPRDRRGRIGQKPKGLDTISATAKGWRGGVGDFAPVDDKLVDGEETPRYRTDGRGFGFELVDGDREREREFLESLRSPDPESNRGSIGGWGLGDWRGKHAEKSLGEETAEDEDEEMDWVEAQAIVEATVGVSTKENVEAHKSDAKNTIISALLKYPSVTLL